MTPAPMTRDDALAAARALWGDRADTTQLGKSHYVGVQRSTHQYDWRGWGGSWEEALDMARGNERERKAKSVALKEKFGRVVVRVDGDAITREWHNKVYTVTRTDDGWLFAGVTHSSLTAIAKSITGARAISGPRFFGVAGGKERVS